MHHLDPALLSVRNEPHAAPDPDPSPAGVNRRAAIAFGVGGVAAAMTARGIHAAAKQDAPGTFVLVPGQWTGAFVWHTVTPILRQAGHDVYPVTCTGLGDRVHLATPAIDLDTHITDVVNTIEFADLHDVVLVGHSYAGMIITGVAEWFISRLVPHPELSNLQRVKLGNPAAAALPRVFILCTADKDMAADPQTDYLVLTAERVRSEPNWTVIEMDDTHMVNLNDPQGTADALMSLL